MPAVTDLTPAIDDVPYLDQVQLLELTIAGFRGVGAPVALQFNAGPGLVVLTGGTGAGKSSFASAIDVAMTGTAALERRRSISGHWRHRGRPGNPSHPPTASLVLGSESTSRPIEVSWSDTGDAAYGVAQDRGSVCWPDLWRRYRPVLAPYRERLADSVDRLREISGVAALESQRDVLAAELNDLRQVVASGREATERMLQRVGSIDDPRAAEAVELLSAPVWDLDRLSVLVGQTEIAAEAAALHQVAAVALDAAAAQLAAKELETAYAAAVGADIPDPARARERAYLLDVAIRYAAGKDSCPVCDAGHGGADRHDDTGWSAAAVAEAAALRREAEQAESALRRLDEAVSSAGSLIVGPPARLDGWCDDDPEIAEALDQWSTWAAAVQPAEDIDHDPVPALLAALDAVPAMVEVIAPLRAAARRGLTAEHRWAPIARKLCGWIARAPELIEAADASAQLEAALVVIEAELAAARLHELRPMTDRIASIWDALGGRAGVAMPDGSPDHLPQLDELSRGERHLLELAMFVTSATHESSPFQFLVLDDPTRDLDTAQVVDAAVMLGALASERQVIVLSGDQRFFDAIRRQAIPAHIEALPDLGTAEGSDHG